MRLVTKAKVGGDKMRWRWMMVELLVLALAAVAHAQ